MTSESISGTAESIRFRSQGSTDDGSLPHGDAVNAVEAKGVEGVPLWEGMEGP